MRLGYLILLTFFSIGTIEASAKKRGIDYVATRLHFGVYAGLNYSDTFSFGSGVSYAVGTSLVWFPGHPFVGLKVSGDLVGIRASAPSTSIRYSSEYLAASVEVVLPFKIGIFGFGYMGGIHLNEKSYPIRTTGLTHGFVASLRIGIFSVGESHHIFLETKGAFIGEKSLFASVPSGFYAGHVLASIGIEI